MDQKTQTNPNHSDWFGSIFGSYWIFEHPYKLQMVCLLYLWSENEFTHVKFAHVKYIAMFVWKAPFSLA